ncbi:hypothetical protein NIES2119_14455 [[Phormidium ambiguum] IAM M-71]|uniref:DUF4112 domain-containing protein n=1 Tax=[Phormidium ambiguum] IAM M-71 TaxID=454136 RepID=A0A1U7IJ23_9CYAN|nr:hypothetical protein NIES2119_14455 [Phormidium ambiguum IAM M-71]
MNTLERLATLNRIRKFTYLMDSAFRIPVIGFRFGLDPIVGLIPGAGDIVSTAFSAYLIYLAARFRLPPQIFRQMIFNVALEAVIGTVPLVGDIFDAFYKSNIRNLALLEKHLGIDDPETTEQINSVTNQLKEPALTTK